MIYTKKYDNEWDCYDHCVTFDIRLDLGNNYSYRHFVKALSKVPKAIEYVRKMDCALIDGITIKCLGNYGVISLTTCINDLEDHLREYY